MPKDNTLYIFDVNSPVCHKFKEAFDSYGKVEITQSARAVAEHSSVVISILPSASIVRETLLHKRTGVIAATKNENRILLECSTIDSQSAISIGLEAAAESCGIYVDSPVSVSIQDRSEMSEQCAKSSL